MTTASPLATRPPDGQPNPWTSSIPNRSPSGSHSNKLLINFRLILCIDAAIAVDTFPFPSMHRVWRVSAQVAAVPEVRRPGSPQRYPHAAHRSAAHMHRSSTDSPTDVPRSAPVDGVGIEEARASAEGAAVRRRASQPVGRVLCARRSGPTAIHLGLPLLTASCGLPASIGRAALKRSRSPPAQAGVPSDLAPGGVYQAAAVTCGAGGLLHHRFTLTRAPEASPMPGRSVFCGTFPRVTPGRRYRPPCPAEPGPSSPGPEAPARPSGRLARRSPSIGWPG